jgi:hypothetical protein
MPDQWVPAETRLDTHKIIAPKFYAFSRHLYAILPAESSGHVYARLNHLDEPKAPRRAQFEKNDIFFSCIRKQFCFGRSKTHQSTNAG